MHFFFRSRFPFKPVLDQKMTKGKSSPSSGTAPALKTKTKSRGPKRTIQKKVVVVSKEALRAQLERVNALASDWLTRLGRHKAPKKRKVIHTASDCSGHGSDLIAYRLLGLQSQVQPVMMSEVSRQPTEGAVAPGCRPRMWLELRRPPSH